jgi:predicted RNase H-like HicB family nuclease
MRWPGNLRQEDWCNRCMKLTAVYQKAPEGGYIAWVEELPGANTQGETLEEARHNLIEAIEMALEANREFAEMELTGTEVIREQIPLSLVA